MTTKPMKTAAAMVLLLTFTACRLLAAQQRTAASVETIASEPRDNAWWKHALVYQVYPRSFGDSNGDGLGDLNGVTEHLDYLQQLGVDAIWLAPIYPSPQVDFGYDISDYEAVDPQYGTLADFDRLLQEAKKHSVRIILDMVLNHTSDKSAWFVESAASKTSPKAAWYVWSDGVSARTAGLTELQKKDVHTGPHGKVVPPNNWTSAFGGSAWTWVPARQQFYYHMFYAAQPDLNWRNPEVEKTMFSVMRFWLDRGVSGFRLDAIPTLFEDAQLRNEPDTNNIMDRPYTWGQPEVHDVLKRLRAMIDTYPGQRVLIGELLEPTMDKLDVWYGGAAHNELQLPMDYFFGFPGIMTGSMLPGKNKLDAAFYRKQLIGMSTQLHGSTPFLFFDNHDNVRSIDRFGDGEHDAEIARVVAALLLTAPGTAQIYYGAEIGMTTTAPTRREDVKDPVGRSQWPQNKGRDGERTPMQWTPGPQAGFSTNPNTWLAIPSTAVTTNVQTEEGNPESLLNWYKALISLRRSSGAIRDGGVILVDETNTNVLSFVRTAPAGEKPVAIVLNMSGSPQDAAIDFSTIKMAHGTPRTLLANPGFRAPAVLSHTLIRLAPYAVWIAEID
jgi:alpha-glucosidase